MRSEDYKYVLTEFVGNKIYTFPMKIKDLLQINYVASRGQSTEQGAVQRILNKRRISLIKDFVLKGNTFINTFILNWTDSENLPKIKKDSLNIPLQGRRAQILDGQHRIAGLQEAVNVKSEIGEDVVLVSLCIGLNTSQAAKIFLNINSEQKPVPRSLIYDLFGETEDDREHAVIRSTDIIDFLNTDEESPFYKKVKYPGAPRISGSIDLGIMVNAMKPHLEKDGVFKRLNLREIEVQKKIILNFYSAIKEIYGKKWENKSENPFIKGAGFNGAFEFLTETLIPKCQADKKFSISHIKSLMKIESDDYLLSTQDLKSLDGKTARKSVKSFFNDNYLKSIPSSSDEYEF